MNHAWAAGRFKPRLLAHLIRLRSHRLSADPCSIRLALDNPQAATISNRDIQELLEYPAFSSHISGSLCIAPCSIDGQAARGTSHRIRCRLQTDKKARDTRLENLQLVLAHSSRLLSLCSTCQQVYGRLLPHLPQWRCFVLAYT